MFDYDLQKYPGEDAFFHINCAKLLDPGATIVGTPAMAFLPALTGPDALTFGTPQVNTAPVTWPDGTSADAGQVVQVKIAGGQPDPKRVGRPYSVTATFSTSNGDTLVARVNLLVLNPAVT